MANASQVWISSKIAFISPPRQAFTKDSEAFDEMPKAENGKREAEDVVPKPKMGALSFREEQETEACE